MDVLKGCSVSVKVVWGPIGRSPILPVGREWASKEMDVLKGCSVSVKVVWGPLGRSPILI